MMTNPFDEQREQIATFTFGGGSIRKNEAFLTLLKDLNEILGKDWEEIRAQDIKNEINAAIARVLNIWI